MMVDDPDKIVRKEKTCAKEGCKKPVGRGQKYCSVHKV